MQRGVDLSDLDVSYVSSLALYFLLMFGLNDVYAILLGEGLLVDGGRYVWHFASGHLCRPAALARCAYP